MSDGTREKNALALCAMIPQLTQAPHHHADISPLVERALQKTQLVHYASGAWVELKRSEKVSPRR